MKFYKLIAALLILGAVTQGLAKDATAAQYLYIIKKVLPEVKTVSVFLSSDQVDKAKGKFARAGATFGFKVKIYLVDSQKNIGENLKNISNSSVLIVYDTPTLMKKSSRMFILSKCKEHNIAIITSSADYSASGAFLGVIVNDKFKIKDLLVNLQNYSRFASIFTDEFKLALGVTKVIR